MTVTDVCPPPPLSPPPPPLAPAPPRPRRLAFLLLLTFAAERGEPVETLRKGGSPEGVSLSPDTATLAACGGGSKNKLSSVYP